MSVSLSPAGLSLQCYSCPDGSSSSCEVKQECQQSEDGCLKIIKRTYTSCMRYADCDYKILAARYPLPDFDFSCCQSDLCNGKEKSCLLVVFSLQRIYLNAAQCAYP
uniref:CD59 glycoprotein n=1 Tax=Monopterus albus TaxID=43700 RepID=A0A3Q3J1D2_MONAL